MKYVSPSREIARTIPPKMRPSERTAACGNPRNSATAAISPMRWLMV
jgi:hypothetical protein